MSFKPYYNWITFNILGRSSVESRFYRFKPYYNWITFNMKDGLLDILNGEGAVLNLIITGLPSISLI